MVASPCIDVCRMDLSKDVCAGCYRTLDEIARWSGMTDAERTAVLAAVALRRTSGASDMLKMEKSLT